MNSNVNFDVPVVEREYSKLSSSGSVGSGFCYVQNFAVEMISVLEEVIFSREVIIVSL